MLDLLTIRSDSMVVDKEDAPNWTITPKIKILMISLERLHFSKSKKISKKKKLNTKKTGMINSEHKNIDINVLLKYGLILFFWFFKFIKLPLFTWEIDFEIIDNGANTIILKSGYVPSTSKPYIEPI